MLCNIQLLIILTAAACVPVLAAPAAEVQQRWITHSVATDSSAASSALFDADKADKSLTDMAIDLIVGYISQALEKRDTSALSTTTQPATVDIKTLPGYWLKDPSMSEPSASQQVDYRTERYRLDDLLVAPEKTAE